MRCRAFGRFVAQQKVFRCAINDAVLRNKAVVVAQGGRIGSQCGGDDWDWRFKYCYKS